MNKEHIIERFQLIQDEICNGLKKLDEKASFQEDKWQRAEGGGGRTRIFQNGTLLEKGGVNFSAVFGPVSDVMKKQLGLDGNEFTATGISIVLHPSNPNVPIIHMNIRYFELDGGKTYWFGGGIDLTPHYIDKAKASAFHQRLKAICDKYNPDWYTKFKTWADNYFYIEHRNETRGIGGIFFDHLQANETISKEEIFNFCCELGLTFVSIYTEQVTDKRDLPFDAQDLKWRNIRRGRYVEFNLVYDRGTTFGLKTGGRIESILMSLPANVDWDYDYQAKTKEQATIDLLKKGIDW